MRKTKEKIRTILLTLDPTTFDPVFSYPSQCGLRTPPYEVDLSSRLHLLIRQRQ